MAESTLLIKNVRIAHPDRLEAGHILMAGERIQDILTVLPAAMPGVETIDAQGLVALPGMIDIHTHLDDRIGPWSLADDYASGSRIALENGITSLFGFVTESQETSLEKALTAVRSKAAGRCLCDHHWHLTPVELDKPRLALLAELIEQGFKTFKVYTTYREAGIYSDYLKIDQLGAFLTTRGAKLLVHCEDDQILSDSRDAFDDRADATSHALVRPDRAEVEAVSRLITIARRHALPTHVVHLSVPESAQLLMQARRDTPLSAETCPQYLHLNDRFLAPPQGHRFICSPPLRSETTRSDLAAMARQGAIDCFATDHCAFSKADKDRYADDFRRVPGGIPGLGCLVPLVFDLFRDQGEAAFSRLARHLAEAPAKLTGIYPRKGALKKGSDADVVLVRTGAPRPLQATYRDCYNPYRHRQGVLHFAYVIKGGTVVVKDNRLVFEKPGRELVREN